MTDDSRARVPYITSRDAVPPSLRDQFDTVADSRGGVRGPFAVLMNSPRVAGLVGELGAYVRFESQLSDDERELAIITTAHEHDCAYEWAAHEPLAREAGVRDEPIGAILADEPPTHLDDWERTIVRYGRELFRDNEVSEPVFSAALDRFGADGVTELTATMGYYALIACVLNAFEVQPTDEED